MMDTGKLLDNPVWYICKHRKLLRGKAEAVCGVKLNADGVGGS